MMKYKTLLMAVAGINMFHWLSMNILGKSLCALVPVHICQKCECVKILLIAYSGLHFNSACFFICNNFIKIYFTYHSIHPFQGYNLMVFNIFTGLCNHHHHNKF